MLTRLNRLLPCLLILILVACGVKLDLPTASNQTTPIFSAGDTAYIRISPDWDTAHGYDFSKPWDVIVGADGYLFLADHDQPRIHVISSAGSEQLRDEFGNDFSALNPLSDPQGHPVYPAAITQDSRLNLFIADSSNRLLVWNQYLANVGVDSVADRILLRAPSDELLWVADFDSLAALQGESWIIESIHWSVEQLEQWLAPRLFWNASDSLEASQIARYFVDPAAIRVTGVSTHGDQCLVADAASNMILRLAYLPAALLMTGSGDQLLVYRGTMQGRAVAAGTGNGTVNDPRGMIQDAAGVLYYAQWGENFSVHQVGGSGFEYGEDDIMEIGRFEHASDVSLDQLGNIYVADTGHDLIQQFNSQGKFTFKIGVNRVLVDSVIVDTVLVAGNLEIVQRDTSFQIETADVLLAPRSVAVDETGIVYIADTQQNRIMRYRLSTELDYSADN